VILVQSDLLDHAVVEVQAPSQPMDKDDWRTLAEHFDMEFLSVDQSNELLVRHDSADDEEE
jgi:hypothetical protein